MNGLRVTGGHTVKTRANVPALIHPRHDRAAIAIAHDSGGVPRPVRLGARVPDPPAAGATRPFLRWLLTDRDHLWYSPLRLTARAQERIAAAHSISTRRTYHLALRDYLSWCDGHDRIAVPGSDETLIDYLEERSRTIGPCSLRLRLSAINRLHGVCGAPIPGRSLAIRDFMTGFRRSEPDPDEGKDPLSLADLRRIVRKLARSSHPVRALRDRAIMLFGYYSAMRASELAALEQRDLQFVEDGIRVCIRRSKTDQRGEGVTIFVGGSDDPELCPRRAMRDYLTLVHEGEPIFRKVHRADVLCRAGLQRNAFTAIVKHAVEAVGLDPSRYGAHSLRAGFVTGGYDADLREAEMMAQTRHANIDNLRRYRRKSNPSHRNLTRRLGY